MPSEIKNGNNTENNSNAVEAFEQDKESYSLLGGRKKKSRGKKSRGKKSRGKKSRGRKSRGRKSRGRKSRGRKSRGKKRKVQRGGNAEEVVEAEIAAGSDDEGAALQQNLQSLESQSNHNAKNDSDIGKLTGGAKSRKKKKSKKKLNEYFKLMLDAKKKNLPFFKYKGKTYKGKKHKRLGMIYKKA